MPAEKDESLKLVKERNMALEATIKSLNEQIQLKDDDLEILAKECRDNEAEMIRLT